MGTGQSVRAAILEMKAPNQGSGRRGGEMKVLKNKIQASKVEDLIGSVK